MGTLDDNDESKLHLPAGSEWDNGEITVLAVVSTRIGTDIHYDTVVEPVAPQLSFSLFGSTPRSLGEVLEIPPPTSNSNGSFSYTSSDESIATISGNVITMVGLHFVTITATQAASGGYTSGTISAVLRVVN
jgi:hypothetical protein